MKSHIAFDANEIQEFVGYWTDKEIDVRKKGDSASEFQRGVAQGYHDAAGDLLRRLERKRKDAQDAKLVLENELRMRQMQVQSIVRIVLVPLAVLVMAIIVQADPRLLLPFCLVVSVVNLTMKAWARKKGVLWTCMLIGSGFGCFALINRGNDVWLAIEREIAPELAGAGLIALLFALFRRSVEDGGEHKLRLFIASSVVMLGTLLAADVAGLSLSEKTLAFAHSLSIEIIGAGVAILTLMDEMPGKEEMT